MRRLAWVLLALATAWLVFVGGGWLGIYTTELRVITVSIAGLILLGWAIVAWRDPSWRPRSVMAPAIMACLGSMTIATIFSRVPRVSLEYLGYAILLAALYLLMVQLMARPFFRERIVVLAGVMFIAVSAEFIFFVVYYWILWWGNVGHLAIPPLRPNSVSLTYGNPSAAFTISALFAIPAAARWSSWSARGIAAFVFIMLTVGVVALMSGSRSGWLALAVAGGVGVVAGAMSAEIRGHVMSALGGRVKIPRWAPIAGIVLVVAVVAIGVVAVPGVLLRAESGGEGLRTTFYAIALRIFGDSPLVGTGPGTWVIQRIAYTQAPELDYYIPHAHDVPLQTLAEQGLVGAVAGVIFVANLGVLIWSAARSTDGDRRRWAWITGLGLLYLAVHDLLDFYPNMPGILFAAALPVAYLDATTPEGGSLGARPMPAAIGRFGRAPLAVGVVILAIATGCLLAQEVPSTELDNALTLSNADDWSAASDSASQAASQDPVISPYNFMAGFAAARLGRHDDAIAYFKRVAEQDDFPPAWLDLASEQAAAGDNDGAIASLERTLRLGVVEPQIALPAGELARQLGNTEMAVEAFAGAMANAPSLAGDPWWHSDPGRAALFSQALAAAENQATPDGRWEIAMVSGSRDQAVSFAAAGSDPDRAAAVIAAWNGDEAALARTLQDCSAHPLDFTAVSWCARLENQRGNAAEASRFREQLNGLTGAGAASGLEFRALTADAKGPYLVPSLSYGWFLYTYRRDGPIDMLLPSLVHVRYA